MKAIKKGPRRKGWRRKKEKRGFLPGAVEKVRGLICQSTRERGDTSEKLILADSKALKERGKIINCYPVSSVGKLDKRGIDVIYQTESGFYLVQIKSSRTGEEEHLIRQRQKGGLLIYVIIRFSGQSSANRQREILKILSKKPSFVKLPDWIRVALGFEGFGTKPTPRVKPVSRVESGPEVNRPQFKKRKIILSISGIKRRPVIKEEKPVLKLIDVLGIFKGIAGVDQVRVVLPKNSLTKSHIEVVCWTKRGIYLFDIHKEEITEEGGLKVFPLNLTWSKSKVEELLQENPQEEFPLKIFGAIMDLE